ncbi:hypothetical protein CPJCM30710_06590 [Clostridium polyendosporum]|uniref:DUF2157 domain-containing protein n=1 Tax=Clostridium polyendosporum TaxID=69208 RepID=A0A919VKW6_9CLOT|nr:DUF2157 domain-containing protein [Clostridium polyendosporum]GIM27993.1 hypothetical protein CPJCM30710_06590 [Clostridium polyendosporum]
MRSFTKNKFKVLKDELDFYKDNSLITVEQYKNIMSLYSVKNDLNFITILLLIGSVLIGLGILTFIASNWQALSKLSKFSIILIIFLGFNFGSYKLYNRLPKTSRSLLYSGVITFGAGIFLVGQMFNFGGEFTTPILLWALGTLSIVVFFKDKILFIFSDILLLIYINGHFSTNNLPLAVLILIPILYYLNNHFNLDKNITFFNNWIAINTFIFLLDKYGKNFTIDIIVVFVIGMIMYYIPMDFQGNVFKFQGNIIYGITGLMLTFPDNWTELKFLTDSNTKIVSVVFSIGFLIFLLLQTHKKNLISLPIILFIIMRYYFDTLYDFMPKSLFFIIGGIVLIGFGYYFEKFRKDSRGEKYD